MILENYCLSMGTLHLVRTVFSANIENVFELQLTQSRNLTIRKHFTTNENSDMYIFLLSIHIVVLRVILDIFYGT